MDLSPEEYRARYFELKANAGKAARPAATHVSNPATIAPENIVAQEIIAPGWYWTKTIARGQGLRIVNTQATEGISALFWNARDRSERFNPADSIKVQWTARLTRGRLLLSDMGRVMASITADSCGMHDCVLGGSTARNEPVDGRNTRDNFILAAAKHGMDIRDVGPCITFFAPVVTDESGRFVWQEGVLTPAMFVDLRAEMDLIVALSNCPHSLSSTREALPVQAIVWRSPPPGANDFCRVASEEAVRAFENTDAFAGAAS